jgi:protein gp37
VLDMREIHGEKTMNRTRIDWADFSWNPIKGLCPEACWYCYARAMCRRFDLPAKVDLDYGELAAPLALTKKGDKLKTPKGSRIFVCSTMELFNPVNDKDRGLIFSVIEECRELTFIILTKRPERIDRPMPPNVWLGVSVTGESRYEIYRAGALGRTEARVRFVSFEPILGDPWVISAMSLRANWIIAGRLTGHGKIHDPSRSTIEAIVEYGRVNKIPVFLKNNLKDIWDEPLIQEYPALPKPGKEK